MRVAFSTSLLDKKQNILPNETVELRKNINGKILFTNSSSEMGYYKLTFSGLSSKGKIKSNETKLISYSTAEKGLLQNIGIVTLEVSIA